MEYGQDNSPNQNNNRLDNGRRDMSQRRSDKDKANAEIKDLNSLLKELHVEDRDVESGELFMCYEAPLFEGLSVRPAVRP